MTAAPLGWGILGLGTITYRVMAPAMVAEERCALVAGVSREPARADKFAAKFDVPGAYTSDADLLADPAVDAVFIATPNAMHADQVVAAAAAGKHVLCDKPLGVTAADARRAVDAAAAAGVFLGVNFHLRHAPWVGDVRRHLEAGTIGEVRSVHVEAGAGRKDPPGWRADPAVAGLGTLYSHGVHPLDVVGHLLGAEPVTATAMFDRFAADRVETHALALVAFDDGTHLFLDSNQTVSHPRNELAIFGTEGTILARGLTRTGPEPGRLFVRTGDDEQVTEYPPARAHQRCVAAFTDAVLAGRPPSASGRDGLRSAALCDAIVASVRERRWVDVETVV